MAMTNPLQQLSDQGVAVWVDSIRGQTVLEDLDRARRLWSDLIRVGIDEEEVGEQLKTEGIDKFAASYQALIDTIEAKRAEASG
jgi:transaldolase